jgi:hypothetical protein
VELIGNVNVHLLARQSYMPEMAGRLEPDPLSTGRRIGEHLTREVRREPWLSSKRPLGMRRERPDMYLERLPHRDNVHHCHEQPCRVLGVQRRE